MTFTSASLLNRFSEDTYQPLPLRRQDDTAHGFVELYDAFYNLASAEVVCGIGTRTQIRFLKLNCEPAEIDQKIQDMVKAAGLEKEISDIERLMRMVTSRKTTYRERLNVVTPGGIHAVMIYQHKRLNPKRH